MSHPSAPHCQEAKAALKKAVEHRKYRLKILLEAEEKLKKLKAEKPPNPAAIAAQEGEVEKDRKLWEEAKEKEADCADAVDQFCNP
ncbi:hypothetical protein GCM10010302_06260 [Streptomyces polychromogenes]|uniref:Uncharacterized protein n=1 Tax=Streptomyces polychromogenes TaxID=67342 RepID=A0ABP3EQX1_9ACTN